MAEYDEGPFSSGRTALLVVGLFWFAYCFIRGIWILLYPQPGQVPVSSTDVLVSLAPSLLFLGAAWFGPYLLDWISGLRSDARLPIGGGDSSLPGLAEEHWLPPKPISGLPASDAAERVSRLAAQALADRPVQCLFASWIGQTPSGWVRADLLALFPAALAVVTCHDVHPEKLLLGDGTGDWTAAYPGGVTHVLRDPLGTDTERSAALGGLTPLSVVTVIVLPLDVLTDRPLPAVLTDSQGRSAIVCRENRLAAVLRNLSARPSPDGLDGAAAAMERTLGEMDRSSDLRAQQACRQEERTKRPPVGTGTPGVPSDPRLDACGQCSAGMRLVDSNKAQGSRYARCVKDGSHYRDLTLEEEGRIATDEHKPVLAGRLDVWGQERNLLWDGQAYVLDGLGGRWSTAQLPALVADHPGRLFGAHRALVPGSGPDARIRS